MEYTISNENESSSNSTWCQDPTTPGSNIALCIVVVFFLIVGFTEDIVTILAIAKNKTLHTSSNCFLFSLCISDLISGLICSPLWLYRRTFGFCSWKWGNGLCTLYWTADFGTNYVTSMHILSFALFRCFGVHCPLKMSLFTKKRVVIYICILWMIAGLTALPLYWLTGVIEKRGLQRDGSHWPSCSVCNEKNIAKSCLSIYHSYMVFITAAFFYVPMASVFLVSSFIARTLLRRRRWRRKCSSVFSSSKKISETCHSSIEWNLNATPDNQHESNVPNSKSSQGSLPVIYAGHTQFCIDTSLQREPNDVSTQRNHTFRNERYVFIQLSLIILSFVVGYMPIAIYQVWTLDSKQHPEIGVTDYWFGVVAYLCLRLSECMNPIMYNLGSGKIRKATKQLLNLAKKKL